MKTTLYTLIWLYTLFTLPLYDAQATLTIPITTHNFYSIQETGGPVHAAFTFKHTGKQTTQITGVLVSSGCTAAAWPSGIIAPGDTGSIRVTYDPMNRPGRFTKTITLQVEGSRDVALTITGKVLPRMAPLRQFFPVFIGSTRFGSRVFSFGSIHPDEVEIAQKTIYNPNAYPITIDWARSRFSSKYLSPMVTGKQVVPAGDSIQIELLFNASKANDWGYLADTIHVVTDDIEVPVKTLLTSVFIKERLPPAAPCPTATG